jgi:hypothetical protein
MGRHKKENPKNKGIRIRVTEFEHMAIKEMAGMLDISVTDLFMEGLNLIWKEKVESLTEEQKDVFCDRTIAKAMDIHERRKRK